MQGILIYAIALGLCGGIAFALVFGGGIFIAGGCLLLSISFLVSKNYRLALVVSAFLAAAALGLVRTDLFLRLEVPRNLSTFSGEKVEVVGVVVNDPERRETSLHTHLEVSSVDGAAAYGKLLVLLPREEGVSYGDTVRVAGRIDRPEAFETETSRLFDYPSYLRAKGISALMRYAEVESREEAPFSFRGALFTMKHLFSSSLERIFVEPSSSLLEGLLLGERRGLPQELAQAFIVAGLIHVVVLSGYNISIVAEGVLRSLAFLPRTIGFSVSGAVMLAFVLMIGGGATAVRAALMGLIAITARYFGRSALALRALAITAGVMVLWNPPALLFDPSFVLSMLATLGLITLSPSIELKLPSWTKKFPHLRSIAASTIAVQIFLLPALLYMTGNLSLLALPANISALPAVPFAMGLGFMAGLLNFLHPLLALPFVVITEMLLRFIIFIATAVAALPFAGNTVAAFPFWVAVLAYIPLTALALKLYSKNAAPSPTS